MSPETSAQGMVECPSCHKRNIPGVDICAGCGQDLNQAPITTDQMGQSLLGVPVSNLAYHPAVEVNIDETVASAVKQMVSHNRGEVIVLEKGRVAGIFTERDLVYRVLEPQKDPKTTRISDVMTRAVETLSPGDPVAVALHKMAMVGCRHMPIMEGDHCAGIVSVRAILTFFAQKI